MCTRARNCKLLYVLPFAVFLPTAVYSRRCVTVRSALTCDKRERSCQTTGLVSYARSLWSWSLVRAWLGSRSCVVLVLALMPLCVALAHAGSVTGESLCAERGRPACVTRV